MADPESGVDYFSLVLSEEGENGAELARGQASRTDTYTFPPLSAALGEGRSLVVTIKATNRAGLAGADEVSASIMVEMVAIRFAAPFLANPDGTRLSAPSIEDFEDFTIGFHPAVDPLGAEMEYEWEVREGPCTGAQIFGERYPQGFVNTGTHAPGQSPVDTLPGHSELSRPLNSYVLVKHVFDEATSDSMTPPSFHAPAAHIVKSLGVSLRDGTSYCGERQDSNPHGR